MTRFALLLVLTCLTSFFATAQKTYLPKLKKYEEPKQDSIQTKESKKINSTSEKKDSIKPIKLGLFVKHIKGVKSLEAYYTVTNQSQGFKTSFSHFIKRDLYMQYGTEFEFGKITYTSFDSYTSYLLSSYSPYNYNNTAYINVLASLHTGWEELTMTQNLTQKQNFVFEAALGFEIEAFITPRICFSAIFSQKLYSTSLLGNFYYEPEFGLKYLFR